MTGEQAYEADVKACPNYHDGTPRRTWDEIGPVSRATWDKYPYPHDYSKSGGTPK
jgi:hypothetical protein